MNARQPNEAWLPSKSGAYACALSRLFFLVSFCLWLFFSLAPSLFLSRSLALSLSLALFLSLPSSISRCISLIQGVSIPAWPECVPPRGGCHSSLQLQSTRWSTRVSLVRNLERCVTSFAPHKALKLIACGKLTFDDRVVLHRVAMRGPNMRGPDCR